MSSLDDTTNCRMLCEQYSREAIALRAEVQALKVELADALWGRIQTTQTWLGTGQGRKDIQARLDQLEAELKEQADD